MQELNEVLNRFFFVLFFFVVVVIIAHPPFFLPGVTSAARSYLSGTSRFSHAVGF